MTPTQRIEAAARADAAFDGRPFDTLGRADKLRYLQRSAGSLAAGVPELHGDKPTHWVAPMEIDRAMYDAYVCAVRPDASGNMPKCSRREKAKRRFTAMRSAYLNTQEQPK